MIRVHLPFHLQTLAACGKEVKVEVDGDVSLGSVLRSLESSYPMLRGAVIDHYTGERRPKVRFFACQEDYSLCSLDTALPAAVTEGKEPLIIIGAISGG